MLEGSTEATGNHFFGYCNIKDGNDELYEVSVLNGGELEVTLEPLSDLYDAAVYALKGECPEVLTAFEDGYCRELLGPGVAESLDPIPVVGGDRVYVVVDTNNKNGTKGGPYRLTLAVK